VENPIRHPYLTLSIDQLILVSPEPAVTRAFDLYALQGVEARDVARFLGVSVSVVYTSKNRVLERLRPLVQEWMTE